MKRRYLAVAMLALSSLCALALSPERFEKNGKFGLRDSETGKVIVKPKYSAMGDIENGTAIVTDKEHKGLINTEGKELVKCKMKSIDKISDDFWLMVDKNECFKIYSKSKSKQIQLLHVLKGEHKGKTLIMATAGGIALGMAMYDLGEIAIMLNGDKRLIFGENSLNKVFSTPHEKHFSTSLKETGFTKLTTFITFNANTSAGNTEFLIIRNGNERGEYQLNEYQLYAISGGELVRLKAEFNGSECIFSEGNAILNLISEKLYVKTSENENIYLGTDSLYHYRGVNNMSDGYDQIFEDGSDLYAKKDGYWSLIILAKPHDKIFIKSPIPTEKCPFIQMINYTNLFIIKNDEGKMGVTSTDGEYLIECKYDSIMPLKNKLSLSLNGKAKIYDYKTKQFTNMEFDRVIDYYDNYILAEINGAKYIVSQDGKKSVAFDKFNGHYSESYFIIARKGKLGLLDGTELIIPFNYKDISEYHFAPIFVVKTFAGQLGAYNHNGKLVVTPGNYHSFGTCINDHLIVRRGDMVGIINIKTGKLVVSPCNCTAICANENSVVIGKELRAGQIKLIAYSDTGKILGTKITSALSVRRTESGAMEFLWWLNRICPDFAFYEYGL